MRKAAATILILVLLVLTMAGAALAVESPGPAPNSHDGIPDGPGWDPMPPFGEPGGDGPAYNGDCLRDGSGS